MLAVVGILYFALQALVAEDMQRLLAYVSISHMGVILLAIFALNAQAYDGRVCRWSTTASSSRALFLIAGAYRVAHRDAAVERLRRAGEAPAAGSLTAFLSSRWRRSACRD